MSVILGPMKIDAKYIASVINNAITEDLGSADITTKGIIKFKQTATGRIRAKQAGIICGQEIAAKVFYRLNKDSKYRQLVKDGHKVENGDIIAELKSDLNSLLSGERIALNFLMHLSGIATLTSQYVEAVKGLRVKILDTRKTTPGLRLLEKQAVKTGGGDNHRIGLYDMYLIKDNHIEAAGSISKAIEACLAHRGGKKTKIEIETKYLSQIKEALKYKIDRIMLDNMTPSMMKKAVRLIRELNSKIEIEASGNVNLKNVRKIAQTGVDLISIGKLTHSAPALDLSMDIITDG